MTTYARIKTENGKTFLVDKEGNVLGQVVPVKQTSEMSCAAISASLKHPSVINGICVYPAMLSAATVDVSAAIVNVPSTIGWQSQNDEYDRGFKEGIHQSFNAMEGK